MGALEAAPEFPGGGEGETRRGGGAPEGYRKKNKKIRKKISPNDIKKIRKDQKKIKGQEKK